MAQWEATQPALEAAGGLVLRPWADPDAPVFLGAYQDPAIQRWHTRQPADESQVLEWFARYRRQWGDRSGASWAVTLNGAIVGRIALGSVNLDDGDAGIGYWVLPHARGRGVMPRALDAVTAWAFGAGFHRLHLDHSTRNHASCRAASKAGFQFEGTMRSAAVHADGRHDMHLHARIKADAAAGGEPSG